MDMSAENRALIAELEHVLRRLDAAGASLAAIHVCNALEILNGACESTAIEGPSHPHLLGDQS